MFIQRPETDTEIDTKTLAAKNEAITTSNNYTDSKVTELTDGFNNNLIEGEGTQNPTLITLGSDQNMNEVAVVNDDSPYKEQYEYKRRITADSGSGSTFKQHTIPFSNKPTNLGFRMWLKDSDVNAVFASGNMELWLYDQSSIISRPIFDVKTIIEVVGNNQTGVSDTKPEYFTCNWEAKCIDKRDDWSCVVVNWTDFVYDSGYNPTTIEFYRVFGTVVSDLFSYGQLDMAGLVWINEVIETSIVYPDAAGKEQYPPSLEGLQEQINNLQIDQKPLSIIRENEFVYVRSKFNTTKDLIQKFNVYSTDLFKNNVLNFTSTYLIDNTSSDSVAAYEAGEFLHNASDDAAPNDINGSFMGANHGVSDLRKITVLSHDKTAVDIGSEWLDNSGTKFYLIRVVDANTLWMLSEDSSVTDIWDFETVVDGNLTHSQNATHTATINVQSYTFGQLFPSIKNQTKNVLLNGSTEITEDGTYYADYIDLVNNYDIVNPSSVLDILIANVGTNYTDQQLNDIFKTGSQVIWNQILYRVQSNGALEIVYGWRNYVDIQFGYMGYLQSGVISQNDYPNLQIYIPKTLTINDGVKDWEFSDIESWNVAPASSLNLTDTYWEVPLSPPERSVQYLCDASNNRKLGFAMGYGLS